MIDEQDKAAADGKHPDGLGQQGVGVRRVLDHKAADDPVERAVAKREAFAHAPHVSRPASLAEGALELAG